ncbi:t-complex protein 1 [Chaetoceros tenuissimus]|uniref:T-complex protein 1 n=1 Tax=Chaetoceros tenuissimus TaxID=426638 RepID=A0AAD3H1G4_9STRA|nr:t-complex protein 1 [Chaetoceros tenuissimus]
MSSMALNAAAGLSGMLKDGHQSLEGVDAATLRNITAAKELSRIVSTSLGPNGMNKLVVNHLEKITVTSDCATIVKELEIEHPAAKMLSLAATMQDDECGDGTNLTVSFAGGLLHQTEELLRSGLHTSEIIAGYKKAGQKLSEILPTLVTKSFTTVDEESLAEAIRPVLAAKQLDSDTVLAPLVAKATLATASKKPSYSSGLSVNPEQVRVTKILGGRMDQSQVIHGFVALRNVETTLTSAQDAKVTVFACGIEASGTEAKGTVLMKNADDLKGYNKSEETKMEEIIKSIADTGTKIIVSGGSISEMALHFIERYNMVCIKIPSKWELRRLCSAINASALVRLGPATPDEMGYVDEFSVEEIGARPVSIFKQTKSLKDGCKLATILLRASTTNVLQDLERAVDDGVHACRQLCKDGRLVPGAGATEMELAVQIRNYADSCPGLDQYAIRAFAKTLEFCPKVLAENAGLSATHVLAGLSAAHANGNATAGVDIEGGLDGTSDNKSGILTDNTIEDILITKESAFRLAIDAALTVLKVDQIIMSKPARARGGR